MIGNLPVGSVWAPDSGDLILPRWTDKSFPATRVRIGALLKPDFDYTNFGLLFPQNDPTEIIYVNDQMDHRKKFGTGIRLHVHFIQAAAAIPVFKCEYRFYNNGETVPGVFTTISTADGNGPAFPYTSGSILQIIGFPEIPPPSNENVSANFEFRLYRDDNTVVGDVLFKFVDYHYQMDDQGSREEYVK